MMYGRGGSLTEERFFVSQGLRVDLLLCDSYNDVSEVDDTLTA